jgi:DNA (cytosine-5)-methyltransferase 1
VVSDERPVLLDLFCGAGGAAMGYHRAGFRVVGVDINPQPRFPFEFHQADALTFPLEGFDAIHASPPCQGYSRMSQCRPGLAATYPKLIAHMRARLEASGAAWVIENVIGAPMPSAIVLCGQTFGLPLYRHRQFESSIMLMATPHLPHRVKASSAGHWEPGTYWSISGHVAPVALARAAMGIDWRMTQHELSESIPPAYTEWIGRQLLAVLDTGNAA